MASVAEIILARRLELGLTQYAVALDTEVTVRTVQRWETGKSRPRNHHRLRLARTLNLDPEVLS